MASYEWLDKFVYQVSTTVLYLFTVEDSVQLEHSRTEALAIWNKEENLHQVTMRLLRNKFLMLYPKVDVTPETNNNIWQGKSKVDTTPEMSKIKNLNRFFILKLKSQWKHLWRWFVQKSRVHQLFS